MASNIRQKLYVNLRWLFANISGCLCSFELSSFVNLDMVSLLPWIAAGSSRKSIWERLGSTKVWCMMPNWQILCLEAVRQGNMDVSEPRGLRWRAMLQDHMARRTCFREQYYTGTRRYYVSGKNADNIKVKLYIRLGWLFDDISGCMYSFGLVSFVDLDMVSLHPWIAAGSPRKSIWERSGDFKILSAWWKLTDFIIRDH